MWIEIPNIEIHLDFRGSSKSSYHLLGIEIMKTYFKSIRNSVGQI